MRNEITSAYNYLDDGFKKICEQKINHRIKDEDVLFDFLLQEFEWDMQGVCVLGGRSGNGKTTFSLQIADTFAMSNHDVLFFTEDIKSDIIFKSLKRLSLENDMVVLENEENFTTFDKVFYANENGKFDLNSLEDIKNDYKQKIAKKFWIFDFSSFDNTKEIIENHIKNTGNVPIVFIDYIQFISGFDVKNPKVRKNLDYMMRNLRELTRTYNMLIFIQCAITFDNSPICFPDEVVAFADVVIHVDNVTKTTDDKEILDFGFMDLQEINFRSIKNKSEYLGDNKLYFLPYTHYFFE